MRHGGVGIVGKQFQPDIDLALLFDPVDPQRHVAEGESGAVFQLLRNRQADLVAVIGDRLGPFVQRHLDGDVLAGRNVHLLPPLMLPSQPARRGGRAGRELHWQPQ